MEALITLIIGLGVGYLLGSRRGWKMRGLGDQHHKVMALFHDGAEVFNDQVQTALGVSDSTATKYLDELEAAGEIEQKGNTGRGVVYQKK